MNVVRAVEPSPPPPRVQPQAQTLLRAVPIALALLGAAGVSWLRAGLAGGLRLHDDGLALAVQIGLLVLLGAFLALAGALFLRAYREADRWSPRGLLAGAVLIQVLAAPALPLTSSDLFANVAYGRLAAQGHDPYLSAPSALGEGDEVLALVAPRWRDTRLVYGPVIAAVDQASGRVAGLFSRQVNGVAAGVVAQKLLMLLSALATVLVAHGYCRTRLDGARAARSFLLLGWNPLFAWEISAQAHNDGLMVLATAGFVWAVLAGRPWSGVLSLAAGLWTKFAVAPVLGLYLACVARKAPLRALGMAALALALGLALFAPHWHGTDTLHGPLAVAGGDAARHTRSFTDLLWWMVHPLGPGVQRVVYRLGQAVGAAVLVVFAARALRRGREVARALHDSLVFLLLYDVIGTPWFQPWYVTWLLPLAMAEPDARWQRLVAWYSVLSVAQYGLPIDPVTYVPINLFVLVTLRRLGEWSPPARPAAQAADRLSDS